MNRTVAEDSAPLGLEVHGLSVAFDGVPVLTGVDLTVAPGELVVLLGPSGCGKSTLLRTVAGLEQPTAGGVWWGGVDLARVPTHERGFGLVFQDHALFGHRDVAGNVDFGLRVASMPADRRAHRVARALALLQQVQGPQRPIPPKRQHLPSPTHPLGQQRARLLPINPVQELGQQQRPSLCNGDPQRPAARRD